METENSLTSELEAVIAETFRGKSAEARAILLRYSDRETNRVRRGIIALSDGSLDQLVYYVQRALQDYRDILYWAEYPDA